MRFFLPVFALLLFFAAGAQAEEFVGSVKSADGDAVIVRQDKNLPARIGEHLLRGDVLRTGSGSMGVLFRDDTAISLGPNTEIDVQEFIFDPHGGNLDFLVQVTKGSAAFVTGQLGKIRPAAFKVETPQATIGIRGTRFVVEVN
ncbi:FecR family protein [Paucidesulfovibrio longus]|uniref:FecR family protein n=1 Tax=Paucidesulfovibrio longus TaxID=889 RepID=UPI0003B40013|nr:FecR family protein [Paucidesulfovibrio longus]